MTTNTPATKASKCDWHTHCLPGVDDGAKDMATALAMLAESRRQGVGTVVATPHFYAGTESVEAFLARRRESYERLQLQFAAEHPRVLLGAEVLVRQGIASLDLRPLCIEGTNCLLLELPYMSPPYWLYEELERIVFGQRVRPIFAHVDRYMSWYGSRDIKEITDMPNAVFQLNAEVFLHRRAFRHLRRWLPDRPLVLLGSDMHNTDTRPPQLGTVCHQLERQRTGRRWLADMEDSSATLFRKYDL